MKRTVEYMNSSGAHEVVKTVYSGQDESWNYYGQDIWEVNIAIDQNDTLYIGYVLVDLDISAGSFQYQFNSTGQWVDGNMTFPDLFIADMAADSKGVLHIVYNNYQPDDNGLMKRTVEYMNSSGAHEVVKKVYSGQDESRKYYGQDIWEVNIDIDQNDTLYIGYALWDYDISAGSFQYIETTTCLDFDRDTILNISDNCPYTSNPDQSDVDSDGVGDACDNCVEVINPNQRDTNSDEDDNTSIEGIQHYGNVCDGDFDNNGIVEIRDFILWRPYAGQQTNPTNADMDMNGNGAIWTDDFIIWRGTYGKVPGPGVTE